MRKRSLVVFMCLALLFSSSGFFISPKVQADNAAEAGSGTGPVNVAETQNQSEQKNSAGTLTETEKPVEQPAPAPLILAAETSASGAAITLSFDRAMKEPGGNESNFCVMVDGIRDQVALAGLNADTSKLDLNLQVPVAGGQTVFLSYTAGSLASAEGGLLAPFSDMKVTVLAPAKEPSGKESDSSLASTPQIEMATVLETKALLAPVITAPTVITTSPATGITTTSADATGNVTADGGSAVSERGIVYGTAVNPAIDNGTKVAATTAGTGEFTVNLSGLAAETAYHVRAYAANSAGTSYGDDVSFTTLAAARTPLIMAAALTATDGWQDISANLPATAQGNTSLSDMQFISANEGWITQGVTSHIYHTTNGGASFEELNTPSDATDGINAIHMLNSTEGYIACQNQKIYRTTDGGQSWTSLGSIGRTPVDIDFPAGSSTGYVCGDRGKIGRITSTGCEAMATGLDSSLSSVSMTSEGEGWSCGGTIITHYANSSWTTDQAYPSESYNSVYMVSAKKGWAGGDNGVIINTTDGINWAYQTNPDSSNRTLIDIFFLNENEGWAVGNGGIVIHTTNGGAAWNIEANGMTSNMMGAVYFTSTTNGYALGNNGTLLKYGSAGGGVASAPTVATGAVSNIITSGAKVAGNVTSDSGSAVTERGVVYSGLANPTLDSAGKVVADTAGTGEFNVNISTLMSGRTYHVRAYATNNKGTSYGEDVSFTTATANGLTVTTGDITDISSKGARVTGYAIPGGIIERGVVYSTNANPTVNDFKVPYTADAMEGPILVNLTYLNPNTAYHVRAYAIDSPNIPVYGEDKVFTSAAGTAYSWTDMSANLPANARLDPNLPDNAQGATTMMAMDFIDANNGWLALTRYANNQPVNEILITHDGGATFQVVPAPAEFYSISFKSASEGLAAGNDGRIYRTLDGGLTWRNAGSGVRPYYAVTYPKGSDSGYACGYWMRLSRVKPVDPVTGNETGLETMDREEGIQGWSENLNCISFVPSGNGWEGWAGGNEAILHWTGTEWRAEGSYPSSDVLVDGNGGSHNGICMVNNKEGWCVMDGGFILHTANGQDWTIQASPDVFVIGIKAYGLHRTLMDVDFVNNQEGWAVGSKGVVLHTVDGGMSWNIEAQGMTNRMMTSVKAISPTCGYALGNNGAFLKYGPPGETVITAPTVNTGTISGVSDTLASVAGNVTSDGGSAVSERGVVFSTSADPTIETGTKVAANAAGTGEFTVNLTGLTPGTTYHVRAFATNSVGTRYGEDKPFITASAPAEVIKVILNKNETALHAGLQEQLTATVLPENASDKRVVWTIASESEAGVLTLVDGLITAKKQGTATVRATSVGNPEAYAECTVTVNVAPQATLTGIVMSPDGVSLKVNGTQPMKVTAYYSDQSTVDVTASCSYAFSVNGIALISSSGLLTANSTGTTVLTATYQEKQDTADIIVASSDGGGGGSGGGGGGGGGGSTSNSIESKNTQTPEQVQTPLEPEAKSPAAEPTDLTGHWAHDCIMALIANGIIKGYPDGTIRPEQEITRAEAASLLVQSLGLQDYQMQNTQSPYTDQLPAWAQRAILICTEKGLMKGYPDGSFKPDQHITRAEMCAALIQAYPQVMQPGFTLAFTDRDAIPEWALAFIELAAANKLVGGYPDGTFQPDAFIKRAEVFTIICNLKGYHRQHSV